MLDDALFHCQQAVEKALKGLLTWHDVPFRKTHSLEELGRQVVALHGELRPMVFVVDRAGKIVWSAEGAEALVPDAIVAAFRQVVR